MIERNDMGLVPSNTRHLITCKVPADDLSEVCERQVEWEHRYACGTCGELEVPLCAVHDLEYRRLVVLGGVECGGCTKTVDLISVVTV